MAQEERIDELAAALQVSVGMLIRQLRQQPVAGELTLSESSALARLDRGGPTTLSALARAEQISAQSMSVTVSALEQRRLLRRRPDPDDGRQSLLSITSHGVEVLRVRRNARTDRLAAALNVGFSAADLRVLAAAAPLIERLAHQL